MADMLVNLLNLPDESKELEALKAQGILIRRASAYELSLVRDFVGENFTVGWVDEATVAFANHPPSCFIATCDKKIVGFGVYESTRRNFFGPTGVHPDHRHKGIGKALLLVCLRGLLEMGYAYAIIGWAGPTDFYSKCVGATAIPNSEPGIYVDILGD